MFRMTRAEGGVAATTFLILMFAPLPLIALPLALRAADWWASALIILLVGVLTALVVAAARIGLRESRSARTVLALSYALMWTAALQAFYGLCVLVTGQIPGRHNYGHQVFPRSNSLILFAIAAGFGVMSAAGFLVQVSRQRRTG
jgi:hypothetical protein